MFFFQLLAAMLILITHVVVVGLFPRASCPEPLPFSHLYVCKIIYIYISHRIVFTRQLLLLVSRVRRSHTFSAFSTSSHGGQ